MAFVLLPCDLPTWGTVTRYLRSMTDTDSPSRFAQIFYELHEFCNVGINDGSFEASPKTCFFGLEKYLDTEEDFFSIVLPSLVDFALNIDVNRPLNGLYYSLQDEHNTVSLPRKFVASLLAHIFFCTMPRRTKNSHPTLSNPYFGRILTTLHRKSQKMKLKAFLNYFRLMAKCGTNGSLTISRKVMMKESIMSVNDWISSSEKLCPFVAKEKGRILDGVSEQTILTSFALPEISDSALIGNISQGIETIAAFPEILVASILVEHLLRDNEILQICGTIKSVNIRGRRNLSSCVLVDKLELPDIVHTFMDAQNYAGDFMLQYRENNILRELNKAYLGFSPSMVVPRTGRQYFSSGSEIESVSQQHSDADDFHVYREKTFSSDDEDEARDESKKRIKNFCLTGMNFQSKIKLKAKKSFSEEKIIDSDEGTFKNLSNSCCQPQQPEVTFDKRNNYSLSKKFSSSISSDASAKPSNQNDHRKRNKRKKKYAVQPKANIGSQHKDTQEKSKNNENIVDNERTVDCSPDNCKSKAFKVSRYRRENFKYSSSSTKDSDYLTADLHDDDGDRLINDNNKNSLPSNQDEAKYLMNRVAKAIQNLEAEIKDKEKSIAKAKNLKNESSCLKSILDHKTTETEHTIKISSDNFASCKEGEARKYSLDAKVTKKPPLPKVSNTKVAMQCQANLTVRKGRSCDGKFVAIHQPNFHDIGVITSDDDLYFSAAENLELHEQKLLSTRAPCRRRGNRNVKESRRKRSFAQRLKETLARGQSFESTAQEEAKTSSPTNRDDSISPQCSREIGKIYPKNFKISQEHLVRKLSSDISFEDYDTIEPCSVIFHREHTSHSDTSDSFTSELENDFDDDEDKDTCDDEEEIFDMDCDDDDDESVSTRYSFSSDYSSELNEVYEKVEEILQPLNDRKIGPRGLAVIRYAKLRHRRALSDACAEKAFALSGLNCVNDTSSKSLAFLSEILQEDFGISGKFKQLKQQKKVTQMKSWSNVVTGNWGCGRQNGDPQLKVLLQWAAASQSRNSTFYYYTFEKEELKMLQKVVTVIQSLKWNVGDLINSIYYYTSQWKSLWNRKTTSQNGEILTERWDNPQNLPNLFNYYLGQEGIKRTYDESSFI